MTRPPSGPPTLLLWLLTAAAAVGYVLVLSAKLSAKLGARNRADAHRIAQDHGWI